MPHDCKTCQNKHLREYHLFRRTDDGSAQDGDTLFRFLEQAANVTAPGRIKAHRKGSHCVDYGTRQECLDMDGLTEMPMPVSCPACKAPTLLRSMDRGLFFDRCLACGWEACGTCNLAMKDLPAAPVRHVRVRWTTGGVTAHALSALRALSPAAKAMRLVDLSHVLASGHIVDLGDVPAYARAAMQRQLEQAGFVAAEDAPR